MNLKKAVSIIILVALLLLIILTVDTVRDKKYEREQAELASQEPVMTEAEREAIEQELYEARVNASWQTRRLVILRSAPEPDPAKVSLRKTAVEKSKATLNKAMKDSLSVAENAVNKTNIPFIQAKTEISEHKKQIDSIISKWKNEINSSSPPNSSTVAGYLHSVEDYLEAVKDILDNITPEDSGLTQEEIDEYIENIEESLAEIENTVTNLYDAQSHLEQAEDELDAEENVGNPEAIEEQVQNVIEAQAEVSELEEELEENNNSSEDTAGDSTSGSENQTYSPHNPGEIYIEGYEFDPNVKVILPYDPNKPHLLQD